MKAIYIQPVTERVNLRLRKDISESWDEFATTQFENSANDNDHFFDEDIDYDDYDPFFDE